MEDEPSAPASSSPPAAATTTTATTAAACGGGGGPGSARTPPVEMPLAYVNHDIEDIYRRWDAALDLDAGGKAALTAVVTDLLRDVPATEDALNVRLIALARSAGRGSGFKGLPKKSQLLKVYRDMLASGAAQPSRALADRLVTRAAKSQSGVVSVTVLTSPYPPGDDGTPQPFSCKHDCFYCPNQPGQPRSYLRDEPAVMRANQNGFDAVLQFTERAAGLALHGHHIDKVEVLVLGGTWSNYPARYQEDFVRDLFYAANVFGTATRSDGLRERRSLEEEQALNEAAACKVIGVTLETRPDALDEAEVLRMRRLGCTRVQIGVQHTDDGVLRKINRGHDAASSVEAIRLLKDYCFKIDAHLMPNLPGAHPDLDEAMLLEVFESEDYQVDQVKIYPCDTTPYTTILEWYDDGTYVPYSEEELRRVLVAAKSRVPPWLRLNRVIRDIPGKYIEAGPKENLRETVLRDMREQGLLCKCIRCREVGDMGGRRQGAGNRDGVAARRRAEEEEATRRAAVCDEELLAFTDARKAARDGRAAVATRPLRERLAREEAAARADEEDAQHVAHVLLSRALLCGGVEAEEAGLRAALVRDAAAAVSASLAAHGRARLGHAEAD
eukprot:Rhum_TRINITY_DN9103_c0_g3::Rhum_TRINITY_DN9103_c0_g3_i1::g.31580::m.31580